MNYSKVLIVDDEKNSREGLSIALEDGFETYIAADVKSSIGILDSTEIAVVLTDLKLGGECGMEIIQYAKKLQPPPTVIMMSAYGDVDTAVKAMRTGAWHFVTKPLDLAEVEALVKRAVVMYNNRLQETNELLDEDNNHKASTKLPEDVLNHKSLTSLPELASTSILGVSKLVKELHNTINKVAISSATVLIEGESGTGKELIAKEVHENSTRASKTMVTVHCAALSEQLLESELFGHEKGSFTGASGQRIGRFELADKGTLFLDEIGEIPQSTQVKLLRALGEKTIERVGSSKQIPVDVRVIAATNRNLWKMVQAGDFREDLYYRIAVICIESPPLRQRGAEDIILLARQFMKELCEENKLTEKEFSQPVIQKLIQHSWPGNVRELRTVVEHSVIMTEGAIIEKQALPSSMKFASCKSPTNIHSQESSNNPITDELASQTSPPADSQSLNLKWNESLLIRKALDKTAGNRTKAANLLGISRRTLQRKVDNLKL